MFRALSDCGSNGSIWAVAFHWLWLNTFFSFGSGTLRLFEPRLTLWRCHKCLFPQHTHTHTLIQSLLYTTRMWSTWRCVCTYWSLSTPSALLRLQTFTPGLCFISMYATLKISHGQSSPEYFFIMNSNTAHSTWLKEECWQKALACCSSPVQRISPLILHWIRACVCI